MLAEVLILLLSIPAGFLIAWLTRDELRVGRKWFLAVIGLSALAGIYFGVQGKWYETYTCGFMIVVSGISYWKSFDAKWAKKRL